MWKLRQQKTDRNLTFVTLVIQLTLQITVITLGLNCNYIRWDIPSSLCYLQFKGKIFKGNLRKTTAVFHHFWQDTIVSKGRCQSLSIVCRSFCTHRDGKVLCLSLKTPSLSDYWRWFLAGARKWTIWENYHLQRKWTEKDAENLEDPTENSLSSFEFAWK